MKTLGRGQEGHYDTWFHVEWTRELAQALCLQRRELTSVVSSLTLVLSVPMT